MNINQKFQSPSRVILSFLVTEEVSEEQDDEEIKLLVGLSSFSIITVNGDKDEEEDDDAVEDEVDDKLEFPSERIDDR